MKHLISLLLLPACVLAQTSGQNVIQKKNASAGFSYESFTLGNSQLIGRTSAGVLNGLTLGSGLSLSGTTLSASGSSLTIGTTAISGGTSGHVLYNNAGTLGGLDVAATYAPIASPTFTGTVTLGAGGMISPHPLYPTRTVTIANSVVSWQNVNGSGFGVSLSPSTPTADRIITFNADGALVSTADTGLVTSTMILDGTIANGDLAGSIALSKLSTTGTANSTTYLRGDGAWTAIDLSSYLTTATAASTYLPLAGGTMTGVITAAAGSVSAPSITFTGATSNTGIYSTGTDTIDFAINGVRRVFIDFNGTINTSGSGVQVTNGNTINSGGNYFNRGGSYYLGASDQVRISTGTGSPEGVVTANVGTLYLRSDGGASTTLYVKESGTGNTGWIAK